MLDVYFSDNDEEHINPIDEYELGSRSNIGRNRPRRKIELMWSVIELDKDAEENDDTLVRCATPQESDMIYFKFSFK